MPFIQNNRIPTAPKISLNIDDFSGGLNNVKSSFELSPNESPDMMNVISLEPGSLEVMPGVFKYILEQIPETIYKMYVYSMSTGDWLMMSSQNNLYTVPVGGGSVATVCSLYGVADMIQVEDNLFFVDGTYYRMYDGTNVYTIVNPKYYIGTAVSGTGTTIKFDNNADPTNDYYVGCQIYIHTGASKGDYRTITDYDGATRTATVGSSFTSTPDNTSLFYLSTGNLGEITINNTAHTICYSPAYLEFNDPFRGLNNIDMMMRSKKIISHKSRQWFACSDEHPNVLFSTDINNPFYIPVNAYMPPVTNDNDVVKGFYSFNDTLVVFKKHSIFALFGFDETDFNLPEITATTGTVSIDTVQQVGNYLYYLGSDGVVYALYDVRTDYKKLLTKSVSDQLNFVKYPILVFPKNWYNSRAVYYDGNYVLVVDNKMLILSKFGGWFLLDKFIPTSMYVYDNNLLMTNNEKYIYRQPFDKFNITETFVAASDQTTFELKKGYVNEVGIDAFLTVNGTPFDCYKVDNKTIAISNELLGGEIVNIEYSSMFSYNDNGVYYKSYWDSRDFDMRKPHLLKQFRKIWVTADVYKYFTSVLNVIAYIDYEEVGSGITISNQISLWGFSRFGDKFLTRNIITPTPLQVNRRGRIAKFKVANFDITEDEPLTPTTDQPFKLFKITGDVELRTNN